MANIISGNNCFTPPNKGTNAPARLFGANNGMPSPGIKWSIKAIADENELPDVGQPGDVYILTEKNVSKIKKVATIFDGDELVDNAINLFYQESTDSKRINYYWGWYFDFKFNSQSILLNGKGLFTYVYFWDMNVNTWIAVQVSYSFGEKLLTHNFIGTSLNITNLYPDLGMTEYNINIENINIIEPVLQVISEEIVSNNFMGSDINMDNLYPNLYTLTEEIINNG